MDATSFDFCANSVRLEGAADNGDLGQVKQLSSAARTALPEDDYITYEKATECVLTYRDFMFFGLVGSCACIQRRENKHIPKVVPCFEYCLHEGASVFDNFRYNPAFAYGYVSPLKRVLEAGRRADGGKAYELLMVMLDCGLGANDVLRMIDRWKHWEPLEFGDDEMDRAKRLAASYGGISPEERHRTFRNLYTAALEGDEAALDQLRLESEGGDEIAMEYLSGVYGMSDRFQDYAKSDYWLRLRDKFSIKKLRTSVGGEPTHSREHTESDLRLDARTRFRIWHDRGLLTSTFERSNDVVSVRRYY